jgi:6-phosphogluconolactonase
MMKANVELLVASDPDEQAAWAAKVVLEAARETVGGFSLALSGGSTPRRFHQQLAHLDRDTMPWDRVIIFFSDERAVGPDHPDSNYRMARETLLSAAPITPNHIHRVPADKADLDEAARDYEATLKHRTNGSGEVDLIVLGMGADGHTASLFPSHPQPPPGRLVAAVPMSPTAPLTARITMTYEAIAKARRVLLLVAGADKAARLEEVLQHRGDLPVQRVLSDRTRPTIIIADALASATLKNLRQSS